jgi:hypothetical protein
VGSGVSISYVDGSRLRRSLLAAADWVAAGRDELNRLNVFPVPDGDTGTNMCLTLRAVAADLARAIRTGFDRLHASLDEPVEGAAAARRRILELVDRALGTRPPPRELRLGVVHGDVPAFAEALRAELVARYRPKQCLVAPITPVIAAHAGVGAWGVFYQVEDGTNG